MLTTICINKQHFIYGNVKDATKPKEITDGSHLKIIAEAHGIFKFRWQP
jgi:hypothetical protein